MTRWPRCCRQRWAARPSRRAPLIAGDMEIFLASDVIYSQRVVPLIQQTLHANGIQRLRRSPLALPARTSAGSNRTPCSRGSPVSSPRAPPRAAIAPGTTAARLMGVSVGTNTLEPEPALNHISGGRNPTFTVTVENDGSNHRDERQGGRDGDCRGQAVQGLARDRLDRTRNEGQRGNPGDRHPARGGGEDRSRRRAGARRDQPPKTTRPPTWRSSASSRLRRARRRAVLERWGSG